MSFTILTFNNYVGILTDAILLNDLLNNIKIKNEIIFLDNNVKLNCKSEVGVWIQNFYENSLENFKINIFYINEEWFDYPFEKLKKFDYVICKSNYAYSIVKNYCNAIHLPFISNNLYDINIKRTHSFLHFVGRSIQKNTELVLNQNVPITLLDPYNRYEPNSNFTHINTYQTNEQIINLLNSHNIHICCSLYESWGHYLFEGLSTGAEIICSDIPVFRENLDPNLVHFVSTEQKVDLSYKYCNDNLNNLYSLRKSFFINKKEFDNIIQNFNPIGRNEERRELFKSIIEKNRKKMSNFFKNLI